MAVGYLLTRRKLGEAERVDCILDFFDELRVALAGVEEEGGPFAFLREATGFPFTFLRARRRLFLRIPIERSLVVFPAHQ